MQHFVGCNPYGSVLRRQLVEGTAVRKFYNLKCLWKVGLQHFGVHALEFQLVSSSDAGLSSLSLRICLPYKGHSSYYL